MKRLVPALLLVLVAASPAFADPAIDAVKKANDTISNQLRNKAPVAQVTTSVNDFVDIDAIGQRAMGANWSKLSAQEQKQFLQTLHQLIEANYVKGMNSNLNYKVTYVGSTAKSPGAEVTTTVTVPPKKAGGRPVDIEVKYDLDGNNRAYDIITDGASLVDTYHDQFDSLMNKGGFSQLQSTMQKKAQQLQQQAPAASGGASGTSGTP
jgi:phospholipid transport system substrate-binding protein